MKHKLPSCIIVLLFFTGVTAYSQVNYSESFDVLPFPPFGWSLAPAGPPNIWSRQLNGNNPACTPHSGAGTARVFTEQFPAGRTQPLISPGGEFSGLCT